MLLDNHDSPLANPTSLHLAHRQDLLFHIYSVPLSPPSRSLGPRRAPPHRIPNLHHAGPTHAPAHAVRRLRALRRHGPLAAVPPMAQHRAIHAEPHRALRGPHPGEPQRRRIGLARRLPGPGQERVQLRDAAERRDAGDDPAAGAGAGRRAQVARGHVPVARGVRRPQRDLRVGVRPARTPVLAGRGPRRARLRRPRPPRRPLPAVRHVFRVRRDAALGPVPPPQRGRGGEGERGPGRR